MLHERVSVGSAGIFDLVSVPLSGSGLELYEIQLLWPYNSQGRTSETNRNKQYGWKDYDKPQRARDASVNLNLDVENVEDISLHGFLYYYDKNYDLIRTKSEKPLTPNDKVQYFDSTSKDPI
ncbi:eukaryotic translation initiation factor 3 subunit D [Rhizophagus irregularis DAOM 181602=DAOM 197198]|nr:eukaryotic translation initiation factor 3 subunit D [Rhizophagus irregularis DAOM 181602=DAOM 197198]